MQEIFSFEQTGVDSNGKVIGRFKMTGILPRFVERFKAHGVPVPYDAFDPRRIMEI
jgi:pilus assembly protein CpaF